ncbi:unnamed protein product [Tetraodon nigroviridis]|uniref:CXXC-type zinc finger protein 1 n=1 Tax=Tetraodon nigroviridis TaxID=99883 RepID=Q4SR51_TETNG|nr:unnamed protein product [Tetraodon nigroviridis]
MICSSRATRLFCDVYNPQSKTYCKRLQVLCPEHSRDPKVPVDEVCGCPLVKNVFELTGEFCRVSKRKCNKHYNWEKLRRAEVDLERVRVVRRPSGQTEEDLEVFVVFHPFLCPQWYKLDELFEQERNVRTAMTNRAGLLALMLHQTIQHDPLTTDLHTVQEIEGDEVEDLKAVLDEAPVDWFEPLEEDEEFDCIGKNDLEDESVAGESERSESVYGSEKAYKKTFHLGPKHHHSPDASGEGYNGDASAENKIKLPLYSASSRRMPVPAINGEIGSEDKTLVCAKCGVSFTGTWYDKQRKRPCCPLCWGTSRCSAALLWESSKGRLGRVTTACDSCAFSPSSSLQVQGASHDPLQKGNTSAAGDLLPLLRLQSRTGVLLKRVAYGGVDLSSSPSQWIPCGQCVGCHNTVNCGQCANCKHRKLSPDSRKRVCRKRKCICPIRKVGRPTFICQI